MSTGFYSRIYRVFQPVIRWFYRMKVTGEENEPFNGPCIICSNHLSNQDVVILAASVKRQVRFFAKAELFRVPLLGRLITALGAFPVKRGGGDVSAMKKTIEILKNGEMVGFYPQGHRRPGVHPRDTSVQHGIGMLVWRTKAAILPVAIYAKRFKLRPFKKTQVIIGKAIPFETLAMTAGNPEEYRRVTEMAFQNIIGMIDTAGKE
ncbi:MAG: lysophospholipid acyltransferase family protein [Eubacteriales bacterium]